MALVRRIDVIGHAPVGGVRAPTAESLLPLPGGASTGTTTTGASAASTSAASTAEPTATATATGGTAGTTTVAGATTGTSTVAGGTATTGASATTAGAVSPSPADAAADWLHDAQAAAVASKGAGPGAVLTAFLLLAAGTAVAYALGRWGTRSAPFQIGSQASAYAGLLVFAGAVERFLEPFTGWLPGGRERARYEAAVAATANGQPGTSLRAVAEAKARLDRANANRTVLMWGLATAVATVAAAASGYYLLHMIAASDWRSDIPDWVDALVTGLVVGTGTKPLHDLIMRAQGGRS